MAHIEKSSLTFLEELGANNNRDWFQANKPRYEAARDNIAAFAQALMNRLEKTDVLETESGRKSMFRIYRDVRFSKNKDPYKTAHSGRFAREGKLRRGAYYFHFSPTDMVVGGGFYGIEKDDLKRIREEVAVDDKPFRSILSDDTFQKIFGEMKGEKLKTAPKGYPKDHPAIDLLRYKHFYAMRNFSEKQVLSKNFLDDAH
ncbi:MAG: DUF2461 domain-containing protein, partial [Bacteroidota bacterium]